MTFLSHRFPPVLALLIGLVGLASFADGQSLRQNMGFNRAWKFHLGDAVGAEGRSFDDSAWQPANLPHSFSIPYFGNERFYVGYGWYRKTLSYPETWGGMRVNLEFDGAFQGTATGATKSRFPPMAKANGIWSPTNRNRPMKMRHARTPPPPRAPAAAICAYPCSKLPATNPPPSPNSRSKPMEGGPERRRHQTPFPGILSGCHCPALPRHADRLQPFTLAGGSHAHPLLNPTCHP